MERRTAVISQTSSLPASDTIDVANTLLYNDGRNNGTIEAGGNVTVSTNFDRGSGKLIFKGSAANQNFDLTGATNLVVGPNGTIVLNKTNATGTVTLLSALQLDAAGQSITFTRGRLVTTSTNILILGDNNTSPGSSVNSYVEGPLRKIGNDAYIFPTGKAGVYSPIAISAPANATKCFHWRILFRKSECSRIQYFFACVYINRCFYVRLLDIELGVRYAKRAGNINMESSGRLLWIQQSKPFYQLHVGMDRNGLIMETRQQPIMVLLEPYDRQPLHHSVLLPLLRIQHCCLLS